MGNIAEKFKFVLKSLSNKVNGIDDVTEEIDTLPEVFTFLSEYKNNEKLKDIAVDTENTSDEQFNDVFN